MGYDNSHIFYDLAILIMARKAKYDWGKSRDSRYQKFETRLYFKYDITTNSHDSVYIDLAQCLSLQNRKLIRQGQVFKAKAVKMWSTDDVADSMRCSIATLPRTWMMFNAYKKGRSLWNQMNLQAMDGLGANNLPKYYDYKVLFDVEHFKNHIADTGGDLKSNLLPVGSDGDATSAQGDWEYSYYEDSQASADKFHAHVCGAHSTAAGADEGSSGRDTPADGGSAGLILAYQQSRGASFTDVDATGLDQQVDLDSPWAMLFGADDQSQQVMTALDTQNDGPPYPADYFGGLIHPQGHIAGPDQFIGGGDSTRISGALGRGNFGTFEVPLGLIKLDLNKDGASADASAVHLWMDTEIIGTV